MFLRSIPILLFILFIVISCDAPRLNPMDPENPDFIIHKKYSIKGVVSSAPSLPIANVDIYWPNENKILKSNNLGSFVFYDVEPVNGWLYFEKTGYKKDSLFVEWTDTVYTTQKFLETTQIISLTGTVRALTSPSAPIMGVNVFWSGENSIIKSDVSGNFKFENIERTDGWLYFEHDLFYYDSVYIAWGGESQLTVQKFLTTIPLSNYLSIYTEVLNSHSVTSSKIGFVTEITDRDGVVDSVIIVNKDLKIYKNLPRLTFNNYASNFKISELQLNSIEEAVGRDFQLIFVDNHKNRIMAANEKLIRIIKEEIIFTSPINGNTVSAQPTLEWIRFTPGFKFHYMVQIYTDETGGGSLVFEQDNINSSQISFKLPTQIDNTINGTNQYYWVIWCIDEFNNKSRSRQATFKVE